ncbi:MAG: hypothetical protein HRT74_02170 [Flavobacteriales bacterium]|nr:hypothetical protein [Flavobacteriales bacterium]
MEVVLFILAAVCVTNLIILFLILDTLKSIQQGKSGQPPKPKAPKKAEHDAYGLFFDIGEVSTSMKRKMKMSIFR